VGRILVLVFVAAALVAGTADARSRDDRSPASVQVSKVSTLEDEVLTAINDLRRSNGLSELRLNAALSLAADLAPRRREEVLAVRRAVEPHPDRLVGGEVRRRSARPACTRGAT
jgi:hypothetical protein